MSGLWRNGTDAPEGKFLVLRRDGSKPEWPYFVIGAADPAAPWALFGYAKKAEELGMDPQYVKDLYDLAVEFDKWREAHKTGDPDAPRHRTDDPETVAKMGKAG